MKAEGAKRGSTSDAVAHTGAEPSRCAAFPPAASERQVPPLLLHGARQDPRPDRGRPRRNVARPS
jgi:hypothetical protein